MLRRHLFTLLTTSIEGERHGKVVYITTWQSGGPGLNQVIISQWLARWFATGAVPGSNPGKGDNLITF